MTARITLFLLFYLLATASLALTQQDELILTAGMDCYENKDLLCAQEEFEKALESENSGMNHAQRNSIKKVLYSIYFRLAQNMIINQSLSKAQEICDKGIALGLELGKNESVASRSFHIWYTIALLQKEGAKETREIAERLQLVQQTLTAIPEGERFSYLHGINSNTNLHRSSQLD